MKMNEAASQTIERIVPLLKKREHYIAPNGANRRRVFNHRRNMARIIRTSETLDVANNRLADYLVKHRGVSVAEIHAATGFNNQQSK